MIFTFGLVSPQLKMNMELLHIRLWSWIPLYAVCLAFVEVSL